MKKLLGILVLGLLISCSDSETNSKKQSKMIEICAEQEYPLEYKDYNRVIKGKPLKTKLKNWKYEKIFSACETYLKKYPVTFKERFLGK